MKPKSIFKSIVRLNYDQHAREYLQKSSLQRSNLEKLIECIDKTRISFPRGPILDAGCGIPDCALQSKDIFSDNITTYIGLDLSIEMLSQSIQVKNNCYFVNGDLEEIPFKDETFSIVISNSVLHWLNIPEHGLTPRQACGEIYRVVRSKGVFVLSVSGKGTAKKFQDAYFDVVKTTPAMFFDDKELIRNDPIGSMDLSDLVIYLEQAGFDLLHAQMDFEPVVYRSSDEYVDQVKAYGEEMYMSPFVDHKRECIWAVIRNKFKQNVGSGSYIHDQFMIYVIAKKT